MKRKGAKEKMWIGLEDLLHAKSCKSYLNKSGVVNLEYTNGYRIYKWCREYLDKLDFRIIDFWVVKKDHLGYKRGQKIMTKAERDQFVSQGGKVRDISCFDKDTREAMRELLPYLDLRTQAQHGFTKDRDIFTQFKRLAEFSLTRNFRVSVVSMDLEDAFNQITTSQIYAILRFIFGLNKKHSEELARKCSRNGHLFQGNTLAPLIFNIWFIRFYAMIDKNIQGNNVLILNYADDITMITLYESISWKFVRFIQKLIKQAGFKINKAKTKVRNGKNLEATGLQYRTNPLGDWKIYPRNQKKLIHNIRLWKYLDRKGLETTRRLNKAGQYITIREMLNGLENWLNRVRTFQPV